MSQKPLDLRSCSQIFRRSKSLIGVAVAVGLLGGAGYGSLNPPMLTSQALVVLPAGGPSMATEVVIARSTPVLNGALPNVSPAMSAAALRPMVQVSSLTSNILQVTVAGGSASAAVKNANAVAHSYIDYLNSSESPIGRIAGKMLAPAETATGTSPLVHRIVFAVVSALAGLVVGFIIALARARGSRGDRLRLRDDIANSIGIPVLASLPVSHPLSAADWARLLSRYEPGPVYAWRLRKALQQLAVAGVHMTGGREGQGSSVFVASLADDQAALALGPQLAVFASSLGIPTALIVGPQHDPTLTATLQTACAELEQPLPDRPQLRTVVTDNLEAGAYPGALFAVVVGVVDPGNPRVAEMLRTTTTVIGVTAGAATADQLARVAVAMAADDRDIAGILVANPDPVDQTTGRIPQLVRMMPQPVMPTRVTGTVTEAKR